MMGSVENLIETIDVKEPPTAYGVGNLEACEDVFEPGISSSFDTSGITAQVLGGQTGRKVTYIDGSGNEYENNLPNPFTNTVLNNETITVRVAREEETCCYSETTFDLIVKPLPDFSNIENVYECENDANGYGLFDLSNIQSAIENNVPNAVVEFFHEDGTIIPSLLFQNKIIDREQITVRVTNNSTKCSREKTFYVNVNESPIANELPEILGCDNNGDGISEYFNLSEVEELVVGNQTGLEVSYFDSEGNELLKPLPFPFTNNVAFEETIIVRVANPQTTCFSETNLVLKTSTKPIINTPQDIYACDEGSGFSKFNLNDIEETVIGGQNNLNLFFYNSEGADITDLIGSNYSNSTPWHETITVRVENSLSPSCFSETSFNLYLNSLPEIELDNTYFLCNLEPNLQLSVNADFLSWSWVYEDGSIVSNNFNSVLEEAGKYTINVTEEKNGIICENSFQFDIIRSVLPKIADLDYKELSDNNYVKINAEGDGDFEYSIDGVNYQDNSVFNDLQGGLYTVHVRDKLGCGADSQKITLIDYPKFFTPNNDGVNEFWQIKGVASYPNAIIAIYDRYGKLLKQISSQGPGWDGTFNGEKLAPSDYWFTAYLDEQLRFTGHFTLKR